MLPSNDRDLPLPSQFRDWLTDVACLDQRLRAEFGASPTGLELINVLAALRKAQSDLQRLVDGELGGVDGRKSPET